MRIDKKNLINLFSLVGIQGSNALFPLIAFPYLFNVLDDKVFSEVVLIESITLFFLAITLYSFDVTAVRDFINKKKSNAATILVNVMVTRLLILLIIFIFAVSVCYFIYPENLAALLLWFVFPLGMVLQNNYFHQAVENNLNFAIAILISRLLSLLFLYIFIIRPDQLELSILIISGSYLLSGLISLVLIFRVVKVKPKDFNFSHCKSLLKEGYLIFLGNISVTLFRGSNVLILSLVSNPSAVAVYALAEKVIKSIQALARPLNQFFFPKVVKNIDDSMTKRQVFRVICKYTYPQLFLLLITSVLFSFFIAFLYNVGYFSQSDSEFNLIVFIMIFSVYFGVSNYMFGTVGLNLIRENKYYTMSVFFAGLFAIAFSFVFSTLFSSRGAAVSYVFGEFLLLVFFVFRYFYGNKSKC